MNVEPDEAVALYGGAIVRAFGAARSAIEALTEDRMVVRALAIATAHCVAALRAGRKVLFAGNGGSAAEAQHLAGELASRFNHDRPALAALALTSDMAVLTAIGNDYGYERVFARQVEALGAAGDVLVVLSTSGRSPNVLAAVAEARARGLLAIALCGRQGPLAAACDIAICVPAQRTPHIQEGHLVIGHTLCALIEREMFPG